MMVGRHAASSRARYRDTKQGQSEIFSTYFQSPTADAFSTVRCQTPSRNNFYNSSNAKDSTNWSQAWYPRYAAQ